MSSIQLASENYEIASEFGLGWHETKRESATGNRVVFVFRRCWPHRASPHFTVCIALLHEHWAFVIYAPLKMIALTDGVVNQKIVMHHKYERTI